MKAHCTVFQTPTTLGILYAELETSNSITSSRLSFARSNNNESHARLLALLFGFQTLFFLRFITECTHADVPTHTHTKTTYTGTRPCKSWRNKTLRRKSTLHSPPPRWCRWWRCVGCVQWESVTAARSSPARRRTGGAHGWVLLNGRLTGALSMLSISRTAALRFCAKIAFSSRCRRRGVPR